MVKKNGGFISNIVLEGKCEYYDFFSVQSNHIQMHTPFAVDLF